MGLSSEQRKQVEEIYKSHGYTDYTWVEPKKIVVSQWVRMKCKFGCGEYGRGNRKTCEQPRMARPAPEAMAVDVYTTVRQSGFKINVLSDYD